MNKRDLFLRLYLESAAKPRRHGDDIPKPNEMRDEKYLKYFDLIHGELTHLFL